MKEKVLVAISGGVDSAVAAKILIDKGYDVSAATMLLLPGDEERVEKARAVTEKLGIDFYVFDFIKEFGEEVIGYFVDSYLNGETPNPCVICNQRFKFGRFLEEAEARGFDFIATGHYAKIGRDESTDKMLLKRSDNIKKDQSYFLYGMTQHQLEKTIFPLESLEKDDVRAIAEDSGLANANQKDSQDICFVPQGKYIEFIDSYLTEKGLKQIPGKFVDTEGKVIGKHNGIAGYTIGQRKGVGMSLGAGIPLYVVAKDPVKNNVIMGPDELLFKQSLVLKSPSFISGEIPAAPIRVSAKTRYNQKDIPATITYNSDTGCAEVTFDNLQRAVTPGQFAVFYDGDSVVGGGIIVG